MTTCVTTFFKVDIYSGGFPTVNKCIAPSRFAEKTGHAFATNARGPRGPIRDDKLDNGACQIQRRLFLPSTIKALERYAAKLFTRGDSNSLGAFRLKGTQ